MQQPAAAAAAAGPGVAAAGSVAPSAATAAIAAAAAAAAAAAWQGPTRSTSFNTYRLESQRPFRPEPVTRMLEEVLTATMQGKKYDAAECERLCVELAGEIRTRVKDFDYDRYKYIVKVDIGEKADQGVCGMVTFLWDAKRDNYAYFTFENVSLYACACVYAIYYD